MVDELVKTDIRLYFPAAKIVAAHQYDNMPHKDFRCTVEVAHYGEGQKGSKTAGLRAQGLVRHMRLIMIQDSRTMDWVSFKSQDKKMIREIQTALCIAICEKLRLKPQGKVDPLRIVPKDVLVAAP